MKTIIIESRSVCILKLKLSDSMELYAKDNIRINYTFVVEIRMFSSTAKYTNNNSTEKIAAFCKRGSGKGTRTIIAFHRFPYVFTLRVFVLMRLGILQNQILI